MSSQLIACQHCKAPLKAAPFTGKKSFKCPKCGKLFAVELNTQVKTPPPLNQSSAKARPERQQPATKGRSIEDDDAPRKNRTRARPASNPGLFWGAVIGGGLAALGLIILVVLLTLPARAPVEPVAKVDPASQKEPDPPAGNPAQEDARIPQPELPIQPVIELLDNKDAKPMLVTDPGGHTAMVKAAFFSPDDQLVLTVSADKTLRVWEVRTGDLLHTTRLPIGPGDEGALFAGAISRDSKWIAVSGVPVGRNAQETMIYLISTRNGRIARVLKGHKDVVVSLAFSHNSQYLASAANDGVALLYDLNSGQIARTFEGHTDRLRKVAFSPDDQYLATTSADSSARIWSVANGQTILHLNKFSEPVLSVAFNPAAPIVATGCVDGTIQLWKLDGTLMNNFQPDPRDKIQMVSLDFSPDGKELLYNGVSFGGRVGVVSLETLKPRLLFTKHSNTVLDGRFSHDGKLVVTTGGDDHETFIWRSADASIVQRLQGAGKSVWAVGWRLDGKAIAWGNTNEGSTVLAKNKLQNSFVWEDLQFGPPPDMNFGRIATNLGGWSLRAIDFFKVAIQRNGQQVHTFQSPVKDDRIYSMSLLAGNRAVIGASFGLYLVDLTTNRVVRSFRGHSGLILAVSPSPDGRSFLSGSIDQTLCLWDPEKEDPLISMFMVEREWIAWTPQGYYAASPYGERLMGWQINHGLERTASFHPAARFHQSLYNPELIRLIFQEKNFEKALDLARKNNPAPLGAINVASVLPPGVVITAPAGGAAVPKAQVEVKAKAKHSGNHPVTALRLLVDGRPYRGNDSLRKIANPKLGEVEAAWTIDLLPGKHELAVIAESAVSKSLSPIVEVTRAGASKDELPNLYVLAAGISEYQGNMHLNYAHRDAIVLEKTLKERSAGTFKNVETLLLTDARASRKEILQGLDWLQKKMTAKDVAIIFFAGHGSRDPQGGFHFLPVDVNPENMRDSCVSGDLLKERLANLPGRVVAMLDACHSGAAASTQKQAPTDDLVRDLVSEDYGVIVMCSSQGREYSLESSDTKHGFFTLGLVEALTGKADLNQDRYVYVHEMDLYAYARVRQLSRGEQNPTTGRPPHIRSFPLAGVP